MISTIYKVIIYFASKRLMMCRLKSLERRLANIPGSHASELMTEATRERLYITKVLTYRTSEPETLYTLWGHIECLHDDAAGMARDTTHT